MSEDSRLKQDVLAELSWEPSVNAAHIGVTAKSGVITLTGHVGSYAEKCAAERAVRRVRGFKALAQEIEVRLLSGSERADDEIAAAAVDHLAWDVTLPRGAIKVKVEQGWITLTGEVDSHYQKSAAENDVRDLYGVIRVSNDITVKPNIPVISDEIMNALHRSWYDNNKISVTAYDGKVTLTGSVASLQEREQAATTAWSALGVTSVENDITIH